jgi:hypothetical protein
LINDHLGRARVVSIDFIWGYYVKGAEKKGENVKEKGRWVKEN